MPEKSSIKFVLIAESVIIGKNELISVVNIFDKIKVGILPTLFTKMFIVTNFTTSKDEDSSLKLEIIDPNSQVVNTKEVTVNSKEKESMNYFFEILGFTIKQLGKYTVRITRNVGDSNETYFYVESGT